MYYTALLKMLKIKIVLPFLLLLSFSTTAQHQPIDFIQPLEKKFYAGISVFSTYFDVDYERLLSRGTIFSLIPIPYIHFGYKLNKRVSAQIGIAYGNKRDEVHDIYYGIMR